MIECPKCKSLNDPEDKYCSNCGYNIQVQPKSKAFRNFIIIIIVVFALIIGALIAFIFLRGSLDIGSFSTSSQEIPEFDTVNQDTAEVIDEGSELGDRQRVLAMFGYPDQFIVLFDEQDNNKRLDSWMYADIEACFIFENGKYLEYGEFVVGEFEKKDNKIDPLDFTYGMAASEVEDLLGIEGAQEIDEYTGLTLVSFQEGDIICTFSQDDRLIGVIKNIEMTGQE